MNKIKDENRMKIRDSKVFKDLLLLLSMPTYLEKKKKYKILTSYQWEQKKRNRNSKERRKYLFFLLFLAIFPNFNVYNSAIAKRRN